MDPLTQGPVEDSGHDTARWYRYQYVMTAAECLKLLLDATPEIVVEWHADFLVAHAGATQELVSVKYRELDSGKWTLATLFGQGGLPTLFARWVAAGSKPSCRLVTNAGLAHGRGEAREFSQALGANGADSAHIEPFLGMTAEKLGCTRELALAFLWVLTIQDTGADHRSAEALLVEEVARPYLQLLGCSPGYARQAARATLALVLDAATGFQAEPPTDWTPTPIGDVPIARKVSRRRLIHALNAAGVPLPQHTGSGSPTEASTTVMARKLRAGDVGPSAESSAARLRNQWYELETRYRDDIPGKSADQPHQIRAGVAAAAIEAESAKRVPGAAYGQAMHQHLWRDLKAAARDWRIVTDPSELLGCAYQLTDECEVWWSDRFDPADDAPWVIEGRE